MKNNLIIINRLQTVQLTCKINFFSLEACSWRADSTRCYPGYCEEGLAANCICVTGFTGKHCEKSKLTFIFPPKPFNQFLCLSNIWKVFFKFIEMLDQSFKKIRKLNQNILKLFWRGGIEG